MTRKVAPKAKPAVQGRPTPAPVTPAPVQTSRAVARPAERKPPPEALTRVRRQWVEIDDVAAETADDLRLVAAARSGGAEFRELLDQHPEASPVLTAGDVDARWTDAYAIGDEAPGGDNPTPDQDRVDDIGKALGVNYDDNEELRGSDKIVERDRHRWELDPASSDDWPHDRD